MKRAKSWTGQKIVEVVTDLEKSLGLTVRSILSDEDGKLVKASRMLKKVPIPDISHAIATCLRNVFEQTADFETFRRLIGGYNRKSVNQSLSYLAPPNQRTKARFMNLEKK